MGKNSMSSYRDFLAAQPARARCTSTTAGGGSPTHTPLNSGMHFLVFKFDGHTILTVKVFD
jgi:hypothetical protein